jgi:hypothetical protein
MRVTCESTLSSEVPGVALRTIKPIITRVFLPLGKLTGACALRVWAKLNLGIVASSIGWGCYIKTPVSTHFLAGMAMWSSIRHTERGLVFGIEAFTKDIRRLVRDFTIGILPRTNETVRVRFKNSSA